MNRGQLRTRVRDLTGIYATSLITDAILNDFLEEAYRELQEMQDWSSVVTANLFPALTTDGSEPGFDSRFHPLLSYRAAVKVLQQQTDDTSRSEYFNQEWQNLVQQMTDFYLPSSSPTQKAVPGSVATLGGMRRYVRDLTAEYGSGLPDSMIDSLLNQALFDLNRDFKGASWYVANPSTLTMSSDSSTTPFAAEFNSILPYTVAAKILANRQDGRWRFDICAQEVQTLRASMERYYFPSTYSGAYSNLGQLRQMVRSLTGVHSSSVLSDATLNSFINQSYDWLALEMEGALWAASKTTSPALNSDIDQPLMDTQYRPILAYMAARDVLAGSEQDARAQFYDSKAAALIQQMRETDLSGVNYTASFGTLAYIMRMARDLSGVYDKKISDSLLGQLINEAYTELASSRKWEWLEFTVSINAVPGAATFVVDPAPPTLSGIRVIEVVKELQSGETAQMRHRPNLFDIRPDDPELYYSVSGSTITVANPTAEACTYHIRSLAANPVMFQPTDTVMFHPKYASILAYAAAANVLVVTGGKQATIEALQMRYNEIFSAMSSEYHADQDVSPLTLGDEGLKTNRRVPWFWVGP